MTTDQLDRMTGFRIHCDVVGPITVTCDFGGAISIGQNPMHDLETGEVKEADCIILTPSAARLVAKALVELVADTATAAPAPVRATRQNIAELVLAWLTEHPGPHKIPAIATGIDRKPSQVEPAIERLGDKVATCAEGCFVPPAAILTERAA